MHDRDLLTPEADAYPVPVRFAPCVTRLLPCIWQLRNAAGPLGFWDL